ncbi:MAG: hypothetical protein IPK19_01135 [Chloroflexi bacterium]|nr:hypothetical protein [Chloroflexota bacterium]
MKINWKALLAFVVSVVVIAWAVSSLLPRSYTGAHLTIGVGSGPVRVTNLSAESVPAQLVGAGTSSFRVSSTTSETSNVSTRQGSGRISTHLFELVLPSGVSEFAVARGANVNLILNSDTNLAVTVQPLGQNEPRGILVAAGVVILVALFYLSSATGHRWIGILRSKRIPVPSLKQIAEGTD